MARLKISKECLSEALTALKDFDADELKQYAYDVFQKAKEYPNVSNAAAFEKAMKEINDERLQSYFESTMTAANNVTKIEAQAERIRQGKANLANISVKRHVNQGESIASAQSAAQQEMEDLFFSRLSREEVDFLANGGKGENDQIIADAFDGKEVNNPLAQKVVENWKQVYFPERNAKLVTSNAMPFKHINEDRSFRNIHDAGKMILGAKSAADEAASEAKFNARPAKEQWIDAIQKHFDLISSDAVDLDGNVDVARQREIFAEMYDNITTGKSDLMTNSTVVNDRTAIQNLTRRRLQPKSMRDFVEYNKKYGQGNLINAMLMDMQSSANKIGMARMMGDSPRNAFLYLREIQHQVNPKFKRINYHHADLYFQEVLGSNKTVVSPTLAAIDSNVRAMTSIARLPLVAPQSISDINFMATFAMNHGYGYFEAWGTHLKNLFDLWPSEERKHLAKLYSGMFRNQLGYMGKFIEQNNISSRLNKISTGFFKWNLLHGLDNSNKMSGLQVVSKSMGRYSRMKFENLPLATRNWVGKFLEPHEWEALRGKTQRGLFTVDNVNALSEKEVRAIYDAGDQTRPLHETRNDLYRRVHAMAQIATENMILNPGGFERAFLLRGSKPGAPTGVALRQVMHFKMFPTAFIDRALIQGYKSADANQQKLAWATATLIGALPLAYGAMFFTNFLMGKSMPDPSKMSARERTKFFVDLSQPGLSLFTSVLDPRNANSNMIMTMMGSPNTRLISDALATAVDAGFGDFKGAKRNLENTLSYIVPTKTTPILSPILNEALGDKGYLEPGQTHYFGR